MLAEKSEAKEEHVRGTNVWMQRPKGFTVAQRFAGFQDTGRTASVVVTVLKVDVQSMTKGLTDVNLAQRGVDVLSRTVDPEGARSNGLLLHVAQTQSGIEFRKWMFVFGDAGRTVMVAATYRVVDQDALTKPMRVAVLSARYDGSVVVDPEAALKFVLGVSKLLPHRHVFANTLSVSPRDFTKKPRTPGEPVFIVAPSVGGAVAPDARRSVFEKRLHRSAGVNELKLGKITAIKVHARDGLECVAVGKRKENQQAVVVYQAMLFEKDGGYLVAQGRTTPKNRERDVAEFKRLTKTIKIKSKSK